MWSAFKSKDWSITWNNALWHGQPYSLLLSPVLWGDPVPGKVTQIAAEDFFKPSEMPKRLPGGVREGSESDWDGLRHWQNAGHEGVEQDVWESALVVFKQNIFPKGPFVWEF